MTGFFNYFLSILNPMDTIAFVSAFLKLMTSQYSYWWTVVVLPFVVSELPPLIAWLVYLFKPSWVRPPLPNPPRAEPLVSLVIAGRNESATIGECIRGALTCGYSNLEVIFVDDNSDDDSVAIARRTALAVTGSRKDAERVRIFPSPRRNGKPSSLNIGIRMARGEYIAITDADSVIGYGSMQHWLLPFDDPRVGAVCANTRVLNCATNFITRLQDLEYALKFTMGRYTLAKVDLLNIVSGMGGLFRTEILRKLGGFDTGLGDDTDMTTHMRKQRWKFAMCLDAVVWTTVPITRHHLWRQRMRWRRNMIKIRVSKHRDQFVLGRYGFSNAILSANLAFGRVLLPLTIIAGMALATIEHGPLQQPQIVRSFYFVMVLYTLVRVLISRDLARTPLPVNMWLVWVYPFYYIWLLGPVVYAEIAELFRIGAKHPYVPDHVWKEIPWW
jgi:cellulose synthase/poly-beta-1,6-N-acetylglucosamine synthase-like glycosyltransferase